MDEWIVTIINGIAVEIVYFWMEVNSMVALFSASSSEWCSSVVGWVVVESSGGGGVLDSIDT